MLNGHLKGILTSDRLAHPLGYGRVFAFSYVIELDEYVHHELVLLLLGHGRASLPLGLRESIDLSLHPVDLQGAGNVRFDLWLINLTEDVQILPIVLLMCIKPVEGKRPVLVKGERVVELLQAHIGVWSRRLRGPCGLLHLLESLPVISILSWFLGLFNFRRSRRGVNLHAAIVLGRLVIFIRDISRGPATLSFIVCSLARLVQVSCLAGCV
jgi:hypothetical protein